MNQRQSMRVACLVQEALRQLQEGRYLEYVRQMSLLAGRLQEPIHQSRQLALAVSHDWYAAAEQCCRSIGRQLIEISSSIDRIESLLEKPRKEVPKLTAILEELQALSEEFDDVEFKAEENALSVVTEPITLEDVYLGPFRIVLDLQRLGECHSRPSYYVVALEPHPASKDEAITHPHVSNETLCEGDGAAAIRAALEEGRLSDFFILVRSILTTYNPDSPYVALSDWDGVSCYDCGYTMDSESSGYCHCCDNPVCDQCSRVCRDCGEIVCGECACQCEVCERSLCPNCAKTKCSECGSVCCESCITDGLCVNCQQERENEDEEQEHDTNEDQTPNANGSQATPAGGGLVTGAEQPPATNPAVQPDRVGQAAVLPGPLGQ